MDGRLITVEGRMIGQNLDGKMHYKLAIDVSIYGNPQDKDVLEKELDWAINRVPATAATSKGKGRYLDPMAQVAGSGNSGVGLPVVPMDEEMRKLLEGLKKVGEDEKQADGVMVSRAEGLG